VKRVLQVVAAVTAILTFAVGFGVLMGNVDDSDRAREERRSSCKELRRELIKHAVAVWGENIPAEETRRWATMCR
jgi:hypothetical protein